MTPIRAVIIGPLRLQCIRTSMAVAIPGADLFFDEPVDVVGGIPQRRRRPAVGEGYRILEFALSALVSHQARLPYLSSTKKAATRRVTQAVGIRENPEVARVQRRSLEIIRHPPTGAAVLYESHTGVGLKLA